VFSGQRTHELAIDLSGLLRGDSEQRWTAWKIAVDSRVLTSSEIRTEEGYSPRCGSDDSAAPAANPGAAPNA
jgi:phage portal protein BeeE